MARLFQALRIEVNHEMDALRQMLNGATQIIKPGGRLVIITYHSLEDRIVKNVMKAGNPEGTVNQDFFGRIEAPFTPLSNKVITPTPDEQMRNPRSRSKIKGPQLTIETAPEPESASPAEPQKTDEDTPDEAKEQIKGNSKPKKKEEATAPAEEIVEEPSSLREAIKETATEDEAPQSKNFTLRKILGGDILSTQTIRSQIWVILLITAFLIIYISNRYSCQQDLIQIDKLQKELQDAKYKALASSSQLTEKCRESHVLDMLKANNDSLLKIANQPPYIIKVPE